VDRRGKALVSSNSSERSKIEADEVRGAVPYLGWTLWKLSAMSGAPGGSTRRARITIKLGRWRLYTRRAVGE
jgi:hypothetical protein